jgi:uncharacterized phiE125 gp8 family phage protein
MEHINEDPLIFKAQRATAFLRGAVEQIEGPECCIQLLTAQYELRLDEFPCERSILLPRPPLQTVDSITYLDSSGVEQTFGTMQGSPEEALEYGVDVSEAPALGQIYLRSGYSWPSARCEKNAVKIRFTCGFGDVGDIPATLQNWMFIHAASLYRNRESEVIGSSVNSLKYVDRLLDRYRIRRMAR